MNSEDKHTWFLFRGHMWKNHMATMNSTQLCEEGSWPNGPRRSFQMQTCKRSKTGIGFKSPMPLGGAIALRVSFAVSSSSAKKKLMADVGHLNLVHQLVGKLVQFTDELMYKVQAPHVCHQLFVSLQNQSGSDSPTISTSSSTISRSGNAVAFMYLKTVSPQQTRYRSPSRSPDAIDCGIDIFPGRGFEKMTHPNWSCSVVSLILM